MVFGNSKNIPIVVIRITDIVILDVVLIRPCSGKQTCVADCRNRRALRLSPWRSPNIRLRIAPLPTNRVQIRRVHAFYDIRRDAIYDDKKRLRRSCR